MKSIAKSSSQYKMTNAEFNERFRSRTRRFAVEVLQFIESVPFNTSTEIMTYQFGKSATSVGTNFRAFYRGRSKKEKYSKHHYHPNT